LAATLIAALPATMTPDPGLRSAGDWNAGVSDVRISALEVPQGSPPLWMASSRGFRHRDRAVERDQDHFVALYSREGESWRLLGRAELTCPDRLDRVDQVIVEPQRVWIAARGGANAHNGCFDLLSFDGRSLRHEIAHSTAGPDRSRLEDLDGDGLLDAILDTSDPYVLCYDCDVRLEDFEVRRWDGERFVPVRLALLGPDAPPSVRIPINQAVAWARAGLWKDAAIKVRRASEDLASDPVAVWDVALIRLVASARAEHARASGYPLLAQVFHGDYSSAIATMRRYGAGALFDSETPLVAGTPASTWEANLVDWLDRSTSAAIAEQPDLAAAYFVRGWARHIGNPIDNNAVRDIRRAADFAPDEALFAESATSLALERRFLDALRFRDEEP